MNDIIKKTLLTGLGLAYLTKDKIEELAKEWSEKTKMSEKEARELVDELSRKSDEAKKTVESKIEKKVKEILKKVDFVTHDEYEKLVRRVAALEDAKTRSAKSAKNAPKT